MLSEPLISLYFEVVTQGRRYSSLTGNPFGNHFTFVSNTNGEHL